ncbi:MAG: sugar ABC transporter ATP-binding protein [Planctomycetes bacterium]|nr:sugar ABC transporter ATP-binding protein [Planctomycetota bacterium]
MSPDSPILTIHNVSKRFGGVQALQGVTLEIRTGETHAIVGENGAGKSTLMKLLAGVHRPDAGQMRYRGRPVEMPSPRAALKMGIGIVYQETTLCPNLSVAENLFLGNEPVRRWGWVDFDAVRKGALEALQAVGLEVSPDAVAGRLSVAQRHLVQIARALLENASVLIFDEPTASLSHAESETLFRLIEQLQRRKVTVLYISHRLEEVFRIADRITVLRDGKVVETFEARSTTPAQVVARMVGRDVPPAQVRPVARGRAPLLELHGLSGPGYHQVSLQVFPGEIVCLAGLVGSGRTELLRAIFGLDCFESGKMVFDGKELPPGRVRHRIALGIGLIPEDRRAQGLVPCLSIRDNLALPKIVAPGSPWLVDRAFHDQTAQALIRQMAIRAPDADFPAGQLSGGNQQKLVVSKWLPLKPRLLLVDEPTKGVDVSSKHELHVLLDGRASEGLAVLAVSSDLPEVLALSHRILVMRQGRIRGEIQGPEATERRVMELAAVQ